MLSLSLSESLILSVWQSLLDLLDLSYPLHPLHPLHTTPTTYYTHYTYTYLALYPPTTSIA